MSPSAGVPAQFVNVSGHENEQPSDLVPAAEGYARWAATYDDGCNPLLAREERYLTSLLSNVHGKSALDLACGTGRWLRRLRLAGCEATVGVDLSRAMLRVAERKEAIRGRLAQAACEDLPLPSASVDLAICSFAIGHVADLERMAKELKRVLRVSGDLFISDLHAEAYKQHWRVGFRDERAAVQIETHPRSPQQIVDTFSSNGFDCQARLPLWLGEPEEPIFARAGKSGTFADACKPPAILICHFRRVGSEQTA